MQKIANSKTAVIRIVVADDHLIVREGILANLKVRRDMKVVAEASDGVEALALVKKHSPDVILLDLRMPLMDGLDVLAEVHTQRLRTKVIVMTIFEGLNDVERSVKAGARGYLLKDSSRETILETIQRVHLGETYISSRIAQKLVEAMRKPHLSPRELEVLRSMATGKSNKEIGVHLSISEGTVKTHVKSILEKLEVTSRTNAVKEALNQGLVQITPGL